LTVGVRAVVGARTGRPEVLQVVERPVPPLDPLEVLVDVAAGVDLIDVHRAGEVLNGGRDGRRSVRVGGSHPLEGARRAHEGLEGRRSTGELLLLPR
jgi:hypothetical protein